MTTKPSEEAGYGSPTHEIVECSRSLTLPGQLGCFVIPVRVLFTDASELTRSDASYTRAVAAVRVVTAEAFGIGTGPATPGSESVRGRLVALSREVSTAFGFAYAVVVTQHAYSARRRWQLVVPVLDVCDLLPEGAAPEQFAPEPWDVLPVPAPWWRVLPRDWAVPVFDTARLISFSEAWENGRDRGRWLKGQIERILPATIDHATLEWIEKAVVARFGCVA